MRIAVEKPDSSLPLARPGFEPGLRCLRLRAPDYNLAATLSSGQAFRWAPCQGAWQSVLGARWVRLSLEAPDLLAVETVDDPGDWSWITGYLQVDLDLEGVLATFPADAPLLAAVHACRGLRLLRQDPWECLASFILSSTKQIVQIQQIIALLCQRFGERVRVPPGDPQAYSFPTPASLARANEADLRACKMGFRAPYLRDTASAVAGGSVDLEFLRTLTADQARARLVELPGVGRKIADCVLLFAYGFQEAFPLDVWVKRALRELYFPKRRVHPKRLEHFSRTHFGSYAGYAQQYLFHYMRTRNSMPAASRADEPSVLPLPADSPSHRPV